MKQYDPKFIDYMFERLDDCGLLDEWREDYQAAKPAVMIVFQLTIKSTPKPITELDIAKLAKYLDDM